MSKVGRNEPCPCGSGKKYKKCCLGGSTSAEAAALAGEVVRDDRRRFEIKGRNAEAVVHALADKTFLIDWCFRNVPLAPGKELCDLLVVFDDTAIIWAVKDLKPKRDGAGDPWEIDKNIRQANAARRHLMDLKTPITLVNARRKPELFDPTLIKKVFLICAFTGAGPEDGKLLRDFKGNAVHMMAGLSLEILMQELDTVSDFAAYLTAKEAFFAGEGGREVDVVEGGEEDLLAMYLYGDRSFGGLDGKTHILIEGGAWTHFAASAAYRSRADANRISYGWDHLIGRCHTLDIEQWERVAREMARPNRFQRRSIMESMRGGYLLAEQEVKHKMRVYRRLCPMPGTTFCFAFVHPDLPAEVRMADMAAVLHAARATQKQNTRLVGISWIMSDPPEVGTMSAKIHEQWTDADEQHFRDLQEKGGYLTAIKYHHADDWEYPVNDIFPPAPEP